MNSLQSILSKLETQKQTLHATLDQKKQFVFLSGRIPDTQIFTDIQAVEWAIQQVKTQLESESV
jgi:hypothetical protein